MSSAAVVIGALRVKAAKQRTTKRRLQDYKRLSSELKDKRAYRVDPDEVAHYDQCGLQINSNIFISMALINHQQFVFTV